MRRRGHLSVLVCTAVIASLSVSRSASQRPNYNTPVNSWSYGDRAPLTGNRGNFYNPIFGNTGSSNNNPGYPTNVSRSQQVSNILPGPQDRGSRPRPTYSVYPWSFQNNNGYTSMPQPISPSPAQPPVYNNGYTVRPQPASQWTPQPSYQPPTQRPTRWVDVQEPKDRNQEFDLIDFQSLPDTYKTAFMSVEELVRNRGMVNPPGPNSANVVVVFDQQTQQLYDPDLQSMVSGILPSLVPGVWRAMTFEQGCCSSLRYHAANESLANLSGQQKRIVHFSNYSPPMYQFIPHGLCATTAYSYNGQCLQGSVIMSLLVYDLRFNPPLSFDMFSIPSYCNCVQY